MMKLNSHIDPVRTQITNTQNMKNSDISMKNNPNLHVCSTYKSKSKIIKADYSELHILSTN